MQTKTYIKRLLSLFMVVLMLVTSAPVGMFSVLASAVNSDTYATVFTASDFQGGDKAFTNFESMLNVAKSDGFDAPDGMLFGGDYSNSSANTDAEPGTTKVVNAVEAVYPGYDLEKELFLQGNHDAANGYIDESGAYEFDSFIAYMLNEDDFSSGQGDFKTKAVADELEKYLSGLIAAGNTKPVFIMAHVPLHASTRKDNDYAKYVSVDNMLLITNDGRKLALDQRLFNEMLPDDPDSKVAACVDNVYGIWERTTPQKSTQLIFCDLSTPHNDGKFNVYDDIRKKLIARGVPESEIAFIHNADSEAKKKDLFGKVRAGQVRVLIGSTAKMGAGTNVQQKLIAIHHTDCPWRPADLQQREGRIVRQGNENLEVEIYSYVTEQTFDAYLYQLVENKQKFIGQIMTSKSPVRSAEDVDEQALSYAEIKALATGNPYIKEKMDLDVAVSKLKLLKQNHLSQRYNLEDMIIKYYPKRIKEGEERIAGYNADIERAKENTSLNADNFSPMVVEDVTYNEKKGAGSAILVACKAMTSPEPKLIGLYRGFNMELSFNSFEKEYVLTLVGSLRHSVSLGADIYGNITRLDNLISSLPDKLKACEERLADTRVQLENAKAEVERPFPQEEELSQKLERLAELNSLLDMDHHDNEIVDGEVEQEERDKTVLTKSVER